MHKLKSPGVILFAYCLLVVALMWTGLTREAYLIERDQEIDTVVEVLAAFLYSPVE